MTPRKEMTMTHSATDSATRFPVHTLDSAPAKARPLLAGLQQSLGTIPNLAAAMAESPALLEGFLAIRKIFHSGSFSASEVQLLALANAYENGCRYCMSLHTAMALGEGAAETAVEALRGGEAPGEPRLAALVAFSRQLIRRRGDLTADDLDAFLAAGYTRSQALEVLLGVAVSMMPNYAHHLTGCPVDEVFAEHRWEPAAV
jgi:AhpD family alkylhydroperoxidase